MIKLSDSIVRVFDELFRLRPVSFSATQWFAKKSHNNDLCPAFERQSDRVFDAFHRFRRFAHDTQGLRDRGIDVSIRWDDEAKYLIGLQIKAVWDFEQDDYLSRLKAQAYEAIQDHGPLLQSYYIVLCVPPTKPFLQKIRAIKSEFRTADRVLVVDPPHALAFLRHGAGRVDVTVENILREEDPLRDSARKTIADPAPTQAAIALIMAARCMELDRLEPTLDELERNGFLQRVYAASPDWPRRAFFDEETDYDEFEGEGEDEEGDEDEHDEDEDEGDGYVPEDRERSLPEQLAEDIEALLETFLEMRGDTRFRAIHEVVTPLLALQYDAHVRLGIRREDVAEYVFHLLRIPERFRLALDLEIDVAEA